MTQENGQQPTQENGQQPTDGRRASIADAIGIQDVGYGNNFDPVHEMFVAPEDFAQLAARARVSEHQIADYLVVFGRRHRLKTGSTDVIDLIGKQLQLSIGLDGKAREETVRMYTGGLQARNPVPFAIPNFVDKMRTNSTNDRPALNS